MMFTSESLVLPEIEEGYLSWIASLGGFYDALMIISVTATIAMIFLTIYRFVEYGMPSGIVCSVITFLLGCLSVLFIIGSIQASKPINEVSQIIFGINATTTSNIEELGLVHALLAASLKDEPEEIEFSRSEDDLKILFEVDGRAVIYSKIHEVSGIENLRNSGGSLAGDSEENKTDSEDSPVSLEKSSIDEAKEIFDSLNDEEKATMLLYVAEQYTAVD